MQEESTSKNSAGAEWKYGPHLYYEVCKPLYISRRTIQKRAIQVIRLSSGAQLEQLVTEWQTFKLVLQIE